jgi:hypothetical protein
MEEERRMGKEEKPVESTVQQADVDAVNEWRERLPEVPLAVPEEEDPFGKALPRALLIALGLAVVGAVADTAGTQLLHAANRHVNPMWSDLTASLYGKRFAIPILLILGLGRLTLYWTSIMALFALIAGWIGSTYGSLTYLRANNRAATRAGIVVAGLGAALMMLLFRFLGRHYGLIPPSHAEGFMAALTTVTTIVSVLVWQLMVCVAWQPYRRRYCPRCGGLFTLHRSLNPLPQVAEQIAAAVRDGESPAWNGEPEATTEEFLSGPQLYFSLHRCEKCNARLLEGDIEVDRGIPGKPYDVKWRWLSAVHSPEETAELEAGLPRRSLWDKLLSRR